MMEGEQSYSKWKRTEEMKGKWGEEGESEGKEVSTVHTISLLHLKSRIRFFKPVSVVLIGR